jgi:hypothetical protein
MLFMLPLLTWMVQGAVGPALVGLPGTWAEADLAGAANRWFRRLRRSDGLSRIVRAAAGSGVDLSDAEFVGVRRLLEQESTWVQLGSGPVEDIAARIASCLPGRADGASLAAGRAIAAGLLEFTVRDLEPELFQQVIFARIDRLEARQASALDEAILGVHADLAALLAHRDADDARFGRVMGQLGLVLDRFPAGPAGRAELTVYLVALARWLNSDPWPQDTQPTGPPLTPAAIERRLRITGSSGEELAADGLAARCTRLVVLGGPGSGKTWLARRVARLCAEAALDKLAADALPGEVELPLYTTCARLAAAPPGDGIRRAAVDRLASLHFDRHGNRIWATAQALLDSEYARRAVGEVSVPFGTCREPSNAAAAGHSCPFRFRCIGCDHFRTDASYLPDLTATSMTCSAPASASPPPSPPHRVRMPPMGRHRPVGRSRRHALQRGDQPPACPYQPRHGRPRRPDRCRARRD